MAAKIGYVHQVATLGVVVEAHHRRAPQSTRDLEFCRFAVSENRRARQDVDSAALGQNPVADKAIHVATVQIELLDSMVATVGDVDIAMPIHGHACRSVELSNAVAARTNGP